MELRTKPQLVVHGRNFVIPIFCLLNHSIGEVTGGGCHEEATLRLTACTAPCFLHRDGSGAPALFSLVGGAGMLGSSATTSTRTTELGSQNPDDSARTMTKLKPVPGTIPTGPKRGPRSATRQAAQVGLGPFCLNLRDEPMTLPLVYCVYNSL